ncbi:MAG: formylglycine-generating enzyme family protein [Candidatus Competibacteraceae bacterium]
MEEKKQDRTAYQPPVAVKQEPPSAPATTAYQPPVAVKQEPPSAPATVTPASPPRSSFEPEMVKISGGCFQMGSPESETRRDSDEKQHRVCVKDFEIGKYEVTQGQWQAVMGDNPSYFKRGDNYPVENVSWNDVQTYLRKLNQKTGKTYRLPTEAEWEYAARAGTTTAYWWGDTVGHNQANCDGCGSQWDNQQTAPVGSFRPNTWGLYDTAGNVWEWTCSLYDQDYGGVEIKCANKDTDGPRVLRGGSWLNGSKWLRSAARNWFNPQDGDNGWGFRLARTL